MKRIYMTILSILCSIGIAIAISYAWFVNSEMIDPSTSGYSASAYFAYGNGEKADDDHPNNRPYGIRTPRQLYNLAWLVYLDTTGQYRDKYYEIDVDALEDNTLDMSGWVLPPIGTTTSPFLGNFNGKGAKIHKLTTSNDYDDFENVVHPSSVETIQNCDNMGFFGIVGPTSGSATSTNAVYNFYLSNQIVETATSVGSTYFGVAAGYVNATMEDVGIISATLNNANSATISEYSVVGYATNAYITTLNKKSTIIYNPTTASTTRYTYEGRGSAVGWGGSLDMLTMYKNLRHYWEEITYYNGSMSSSAPNVTNSTIPYYTAKTITYKDNGTTEETLSGATRNLISRSSINNSYLHTVGSTNDVRFYDKSKTDGGKKTASISFVMQPNNISNSYQNEWQYMCLTGYANRTMNDQTQTVTFTYENGKYITDNANYLAYNSTSSIKNVTSIEEASPWYLEGSYYYTYPSFSDRTTRYYLTDDNGSLTLSTVKTTTWTYSSSSLMSSANRYLVYENGWKLQTSLNITRTGGYTISSGSYYLTKSGTGITYGNNTNASIWYVNSNNEIYTYNGDTIEYLYCNRTGWGRYTYTPTLGSSAPYRYVKNGRKIYCSSYNRYINGTSFSDNTNGTNYTWTDATESGTFALTLANATYQNTVKPTFETPDTYYPLQSTDYGVPASNNTGYMVSGANYFTDAYGDIRVSAFENSDLSGDYNDLTKVRTINASGDHDLTSSEISNYAKFDKSKAKLKAVLQSNDAKMTNGKFNISGDSYIFGLHFMNATIGKTTSQGHEVRIPKAVINGNEYTNYQVPFDCIDFNLKEKGYINFFAGSYYQNSTSGDNDSFFSLYEIYRDGNAEDITTLLEIVEIYKSSDDSYSYVYKYSNGKYSQPFKFVTNDQGNKVKESIIENQTYSHNSNNLANSYPSGYTKVFDTAWIKGSTVSNLTMNAAYYFEIPVNDGEYALGSVTGKNGAYLMYLDIGANATEVYRSETQQKTEITTASYKYPKGVAIVGDSSSDIIPRNSAVAKITSASTHTISFTAAEGNTPAAITISGAASSSYICPDVKLNTNMTATGTNSTTVTIQQLMYVDYVKADTNSTYVTLITKIGNDTTGEYYLIEGDGVPDDQGGWGLFKSPQNSGDALEPANSASEFTLNTTNSNTAKEEHYYYTSATATTKDTIKMLADSGTTSGDGKSYQCAGDNIYIETDETIKVYVTKKETGLTYSFFFNLDLENDPYPPHTDATPITINNNSSYEYTYTATP